MGQKKDIESLFENKLNNGKKTPNKNLWEKINHSLDEEMRKRKRKLFYWFASGGVLLSLSLFLLIDGYFAQQDSPNQQTNTPLVDRSDASSEVDKNNVTDFKVATEDSLNHKNNKEVLSKIEISQENLEKTEVEVEDSQKPEQANNQTSSTSKSKIDKPNKDSIDEIYTVSTKYYYYNSDDGQQMVTSDKSKIDSIISKKQYALDSTTTKKPNNLEE